MSQDLTTPGLTDLNAFLQQLAKADILLQNQLKALQDQVKDLQSKDKSLEAKDAKLQQEITAEQKVNTEQQKEIDANESAIATEIAARKKADTELKNAIDKEKSAREAADALMVKDIEELQGDVKELKFEIKKLGGWGRIYGGNGGLPHAGSGKQITGIRIETDALYLDSIQFQFDGNKNWGTRFGIRKGTPQEIICQEGEYFSKVIIRYEPDNYTLQNKSAETTVIGRIEFITNKGRRMVGGKNDGNVYIEAKGILAGVSLRSGTLVDQLQFYWRAN